MEGLKEVTGPSSSHNLADAGEIVSLVTESLGITQAVEAYTNYLSKMSCNLLFFCDFDSFKQQESNIIWSAMGSEAEKLIKNFDPVNGCPLCQIAVKNGSPVEAMSFYLTGYDELLNMRYLKEVKELGFAQMAVIPVSAGERVFVAFIGVRGRKFEGHFREMLLITQVEFVTALLCRFSHLMQHSANAGRSSSYNLSKREKECLEWCAQGKTSYEISIILKLSEHTINNYISNACRRLDAANKSHAVAKAIQLGIIESTSLF